MKIIDVNAGAGFWPTQHFSVHTPDELDRFYQMDGIDEVWLSAVESILFPEPDTFDFRLFGKIAGLPRFRPVKTVHPILGNWRRSCEEALAGFPVVALKVFPNYHGYSLGSGPGDALCHFARERNLPLLESMRVNDERNQPSCMEVTGVPAEDIVRLSLRHPENRIHALCAYMHELKVLATGSPNLMVDLSFLDDAETIATASRFIAPQRIVFGTHAPFLHVRAAALKLAHGALDATVHAAIAHNNVLKPSL